MNPPDYDIKSIALRLLTITLALSIIGVIYITITPNPSGVNYTEFYVLGPNGTADSYPTNLTVAEQTSIIIGVHNFENEQVSYQLHILWDNSTTHQQEIHLPHDQTFEDSFTVVAPGTPGIYRLRFHLYRSGVSSDGPYRSHGMRIVVRE